MNRKFSEATRGAMVFSSRLPYDLSENPLSRRVRELRAAGMPLLDLTLSNPTRAEFHFPEEEISAAFAEADASRYEPHPRGLLPAREAIAMYYREDLGEATRSGALKRAEASDDEESAGKATGNSPVPLADVAAARTDGLRVDPKHLHCTASSSEAYSMLFKLLCDPGDEICIPLPAYPLFSWLAALDAVTVRTYNLRLAPDGRWHIDMHSLDMAISARTRAVIVVNPSNPAANYLRPAEFAQLDSLCARNRIALITDEVFWDFPLVNFVGGEKGAGIPEDEGRNGGIENGIGGAERSEGKESGIGGAERSEGKENGNGGAERSEGKGKNSGGIAIERQRTAGIPGEALRFTINGLSKLLALPQMKLGWILTEGAAALRDDALARLDVISDAYLSVGTPVMAAAQALLQLREGIQAQIRSRCLRNLHAAAEILGEHSTGGPLLPPEGGWSAVIALPDGADEEAIALRLLEEERVLVHPGYLFDFARGKYLVVSLLCEESRFAEGIRKLSGHVS
ncbi:MAG: pyridoxal phosphate-dependent aminotransferase [Bacteroidota bacterium]